MQGTKTTRTTLLKRIQKKRGRDRSDSFPELKELSDYSSNLDGCPCNTNINNNKNNDKDDNGTKCVYAGRRMWLGTLWSFWVMLSIQNSLTVQDREKSK